MIVSDFSSPTREIKKEIQNGLSKTPSDMHNDIIGRKINELAFHTHKFNSAIKSQFESTSIELCESELSIIAMQIDYKFNKNKNTKLEKSHTDIIGLECSGGEITIPLMGSEVYIHNIEILLSTILDEIKYCVNKLNVLKRRAAIYRSEQSSNILSFISKLEHLLLAFSFIQENVKHRRLAGNLFDRSKKILSI